MTTIALAVALCAAIASALVYRIQRDTARNRVAVLEIALADQDSALDLAMMRIEQLEMPLSAERAVCRHQRETLVGVLLERGLVNPGRKMTAAWYRAERGVMA